VALKATAHARIRILLILALAIAVITAVLWIRGRSGSQQSLVYSERTAPVTEASPTTAPLTSPTQLPAPASITPSFSPTPNAPGMETTSPAETHPDLDQISGIVVTPKLIIPLVGVRPDQLLDTFSDARSEGRVHDAIDIPAPQGTPVIAAADGEIVKLFQSDRGGTTIYQLSTDKKLVFYYAHLQRYADGLVVGKFVRQGETMAYVGDTGNAGAGNFHLHFSISLIADPRRYWEGTNINPYPLLHK
jgi:murein DD-endopeptidase MepM/ murein hydrolase activator NlpD